MTVIGGAASVLLAHAHPDDETIASGALIARLIAEGAAVTVLTASRGERGEIVDGSAPQDLGADRLAALRERELAAALAALGGPAHVWLGAAPARADGPDRRYEDSGMRWIRDGLAGPSGDAGPEALTSAPVDEVVADVAAALVAAGADLLVTYDDGGGYGHPDHVRIRDAAVAAAGALGVPVLELARPDAPGAERVDGAPYAAALRAALDAHRTQLTVDGDDIVHSGGQREPIRADVWLRPVAAVED